MAYCVPLGIPPSIFRGRRWPNPHNRREAKWMPADVAEVIGYRAYENRRCKCGTHPDEWPEDERADEPYFAQPHRCPGCAMIDEAYRELPTTKGARDGISVILVPFDEDEFAEWEEAREAQRLKTAIAEAPGLL